MPIVRIEPDLRGENRRVAIVQSRFNARIGEGLLAGALRALREAGVADDRITLVSVPGALEIPLALQRLAQSGDHDALVAIGAVIRGDTYHFDIVANESARALIDLAINERLALGNGILTVENEAQANARARVEEGDKGGAAARAALTMVALKHTLVWR